MRTEAAGSKLTFIFYNCSKCHILHNLFILMLIFTYLQIYQISALLQRGLHWTSLQARTTALLIWPDCASWSDQSGDYITTQMNLASSGYCLLWPLVLDHRMKGFTRIQYSVSKMLSLMFCIHLDKHWPLSLIQCIFKMNELKGPVGGI